MTEDDKQWARDAAENGWSTAHLAASWPWRVWGVRHVRFAFHLWRADAHASAWAGLGIGLGHIQPCDRWVLYAILRGWA